MSVFASIKSNQILTPQSCLSLSSPGFARRRKWAERGGERERERERRNKKDEVDFFLSSSLSRPLFPHQILFFPCAPHPPPHPSSPSLQGNSRRACLRSHFSLVSLSRARRLSEKTGRQQQRRACFKSSRAHQERRRRRPPLGVQRKNLESSSLRGRSSSLSIAAFLSLTATVICRHGQGLGTVGEAAGVSIERER